MMRMNRNLMKDLMAFLQKSRSSRQTPVRSGSPKTWWANFVVRAAPGGEPAGVAPGVRREDLLIAGVGPASQ